MVPPRGPQVIMMCCRPGRQHLGPRLCLRSASPESTQAFLLIGTLFLLPIILMYTAWSYWVFRGKVRGDTGYY